MKNTTRYLICLSICSFAGGSNCEKETTQYSDSSASPEGFATRVSGNPEPGMNETSNPYTPKLDERCASPSGRLTHADVLSVIKNRMDELHECCSSVEPGEVVKISWWVGCNGNPISIWTISDKYRNSETSLCFERKIKLIDFGMPSSGPLGPVNIPIKC